MNQIRMEPYDPTVSSTNSLVVIRERALDELDAYVISSWRSTSWNKKFFFRENLILKSTHSLRNEKRERSSFLNVFRAPAEAFSFCAGFFLFKRLPETEIWYLFKILSPSLSLSLQKSFPFALQGASFVLQIFGEGISNRLSDASPAITMMMRHIVYTIGRSDVWPKCLTSCSTRQSKSRAGTPRTRLTCPKRANHFETSS